MDNFWLGLQSGVPTLSQYFGAFNLTSWTAMVLNLFGDWIELATLGGHRIDNFGLGLQSGVPTMSQYFGTFNLTSWTAMDLTYSRIG
jgi:hypothetical protein